MSDVGSEPRRYGKIVMTAITGAVGAIALGLWQGVGTSLASFVMSPLNPAPAPAPEASATAATVGISAKGGDGAPFAQPESSSMSSDVVRLRTTLSFSGIGKGATEGAACSAALSNVAEQADRQCRKIVIEQKGAGFRLEDGARECRSCAPLGDSWRCVASVTPRCVVTGETM